MPGILHVSSLDAFIPAFDVPWSDLPPAPPIPESKWKPAPLESEDVWELVREWYISRGQTVPKEEAEACLNAIKKEKKEQEKMAKQLEEIQKPEVEGAPKKKPSSDTYLTGPMPEFGTKEYWAAYWARKKAAGYVPKKKTPTTGSKT